MEADWWCSSHSSAESHSYSNPLGESRQGAGNCLGEVVVETGVGDRMCKRRRWISAGENSKEKGKEGVSREK